MDDKIRKQIVSIFASFLVLASLFFFAPLTVASTLSLTPASGTYGQGSTFGVNIFADAGGDSINAVQANLSYPADKLQFLSISTGGSVLSIIAEKAGGGEGVRIAGGNPSSFSGSKFIAAVYFKVLADSGSGSLSFSGDSAVIRSSDNQNSLAGTGGATFNFSSSTTQAESSPESSSDSTVEKEAEVVPAPKITEVKITDVKKNTAIISWKTDIEATSSVEFGLTSSYGLLATSDEKVTDHKVDLPQGMLYPGTEYHFKVVSQSDHGRESETNDSIFTTKGYTVIVRVVTKENKPVEGAEVKFYSEVKRNVTDKDGKAKFTDVSPGNHVAVVSYKDVSETQEIEVKEVDTPQIFEKKISPSLFAGFKFNYLVLSIILIVAITSIVLVVNLLRIRKKKFSI